MTYKILKSTSGTCIKHDLDDFYGDQEFFVIGDRVYVDNYKPASVAYFGEVDFASGDWVGVVLDEPLGNHDGKLHGRQYFQCTPSHGLFVRPSRVSRMRPDSRLDYEYSSPILNEHRHLNSPASQSYSPMASSTTSGYYYDDDYRRESTPTVESLVRKLSSLDSGLGNRFSSSSSAASPSAHTMYEDSSYRPSRSSTPVGILKRSTTAQQDLKSKIDDVSRRIRAQSASRTQNHSDSVFNFRPKREPLEHNYVNNDSQDISGRVTSNKTVNLSSEPLRRGDRVLARSERGDLSGILRFMGETDFATGEWAGIELETPDGKNDGSVLGYRYFQCRKNYGLFVPLTRVRKFNQTSHKEFGLMRSTILSPPPHPNGTSGYYSNSNSVTPSHELSSVSSTTSTSPYSSEQYNSFSKNLHNDTHEKYNSLSRLFGPTDRIVLSKQKEKFDDRDIEVELKKSLEYPGLNMSRTKTGTRFADYETPKPKSIKYTFSSSKYDGNPIARRTVLYD